MKKNALILIVEDDDMHFELIERGFENNLEFSIVRAENLAQARRQIDIFRPDLVIVDWKLPDGVGSELIEKDESGLPVLPIMLMTSFGNETLAVEAIKMGALDYIVKSPDAFADMAHIAERALKDWRFSIEHQKALVALKESEEKFHTAFEYANVGLALVAPKGEILKVNPKAGVLLGYSFQEIATKSLESIVLSEDYKIVQKRMLNIFLGDINSFQVESRLISKSNDIIWTLLNLAAYKNNKGTIEYFIAQFVDITYQKQAEQEIVKLNEALEQRVIERTAELNSALNDIENANEELRTLNELVAKDAQRLLFLNEELEESEKELKELNKELENRVSQRTSELKQAKEEAENASRIKSIILQNLGHEIRTPLNGMLGIANYLKKEIKDVDNLELIDLIINSGKRLFNTLNSLLIISELESGSIIPNPKRIELGAFVEEYFRNHNEHIEKDLYLEIKVDSEIYSYVDDYVLQQILFHIYSNAVKFTDNGGITVSVSQISDNGSLNCARIIISDTGRGINESAMDKIFEPFRQASEGMSRSFEGLGLGLTITKKMMDILAGRIYIISEENKGASVYLEFPCNS